MNYKQTIDYLYSQLPMFSRIGSAAYKKDLHNTLALCEALGQPQQQFKSIHIAGTNGKGSTSHMLAAMFQEAGYKTGLYTSPHIRDFGERIKVNGEMIDEDFVIHFTEKTMALQEQVRPSFFELTVAMAFDYFAKKQVDIAIIETGLGGRLDSTNVISPVLSIITNIGYDHMNILGNTLEEIAFEKAGIIKPNTPVLIGETHPSTTGVFLEKATQCEAELSFAENVFSIVQTDGLPSMLTVDITDQKTGEKKILETDLLGSYQIKNIRTAIAARKLLTGLGFPIAEAAMFSALSRVKRLTGLMGRWELIKEKPTLIFDVAHNEAGVNVVLEQLQANYPRCNWHFVLGFVNDKSLEKILSLFPASATYYFTNAHIPRALPYENLMQQAAAFHLAGKGYDDVNTAIRAALASAEEADVIMVCGSFFIIAETQPGTY
jgi:dihydrofolate synthase / folylpolyglutamate synthase